MQISGEAVFVTIVGLLASVLTTASYVPQLVKAWRTGQADDLSLRMLLVLLGGLLLWIVYGLLQRDMVVIIANSTSSILLIALVALKLGVRPGGG